MHSVFRSHMVLAGGLMAGIALTASPTLADEIVIFKSVPTAEEVNNVLFGNGGVETKKPLTRSLLPADPSSGLGATRAIRMHNSAQDTAKATAPVAATAAPAPAATASAPAPAPAAEAPVVTASAEPTTATSGTGVGLGFNLQFGFDSVALEGDSKAYIDRLGEVLGQPENAGKQLLIVGHTDGSGDDGYNSQLSERRALAVRDYLATTWSVDANLLQIQGAGETQPLDGTDPFDGINRRVEFFALN